MAKPPKKDEGAKNPLEEMACSRRREARQQKTTWDLDFRECYFFLAPHRQRSVTSTTTPSSKPQGDADELQTSVGFIVAQDFVTEVVNNYMPEAQPWCDRRAGMFLPDAAWEQIQDAVRAGDQKIFDAMRASNLYPELTKSFYPDLAIGTCALWIERKKPYMPITVMAVPLRELECNLGPDGAIDDRFVVRHTRNSHVRALLGKEIWENLPAQLKREIEGKPGDKTEISWGFWRQWDRDDDEVWQHVVMVKEKLVHNSELVGEGSCPLIVPRWNPSADWPWGLGPAIQGLPDLRQIDELESQKISNIELHLTPPISFPDDSFAAVENGFEPRYAYPIRPGTEGAIKPIYQPSAPDPAVYQLQEMEHRLRKLFFVDMPEQTGDTPPTLGQWLDEMARAQRRIGTPGLPFWREGPAQIFLRFKFLLEKAGVIAPVKVDGKTVALSPYNPTQRGAEQQDIAMAVRFIEIAGQAFPEEFKAWVDGKKTMDAFIAKMRVTLIKFRSPKEVEAAIAQIQQLMGGATPGGQPVPAAGVQ